MFKIQFYFFPVLFWATIWGKLGKIYIFEKFGRKNQIIRWVGCWTLEKGNYFPEVVFNFFDIKILKLSNLSRSMFF